MPKYEKGIFGVRKDPKNQILFSFKARDGEEWPSDDDDSDYDPGKEPVSNAEQPGPSKSTKKNTAKKSGNGKKKPQRKRKRVAACGEEDTKRSRSLVEQYTGNVAPLPTEIWMKIFGYVTQTEGAIPFLLHAEKVCKLWKEVASHPGLWSRVDLSYGWIKFKEASFRRFCQTRLTECTWLNVSGCPFMCKMGAVKAIADHCVKLKAINLSGCNKLPADSVVTILTGCSSLEDIDLTSTTVDSVSSQTLCHVVKQCGSRLRRLVVASNLIRGFSTVLNAIMDQCPQLEHLDISNTILSSGSFTLDVEKFQASCPHLRTLGIADSSFRTTQVSAAVREAAPGFPEMEELSLATNEDSASAVEEHTLLRLLNKSERLRLLDLRGCKNSAAVSSLDVIPATNLEQLHLSRSAVSTCENLHLILAKWRHSLTDLDLSWNNFRGYILDLGLMSICRGEVPAAMVNLNLAGTNVSMDMIKKLLHSLPNLNNLDLSSCRDVARGCKRAYKTRTEIISLRDSL